MRLICLMLRNFGLNSALRALVLDLLITSPPQQKAILAELLESLVYSGHVTVLNGRHMVDDYELVPAIGCIEELFSFNKQLHDSALQHFLGCATFELSFENGQRLSLKAVDDVLHLVECRSTYFPLASMRFTAADMLPHVASIKKLMITFVRVGPKSTVLAADYTPTDVQADLRAVSRLALLGQVFTQLEQLIVVVRPSDWWTPLPADEFKIAQVLARAVEAMRELTVEHKFAAFSSSIWRPMSDFGVDVEVEGGIEGTDDEVGAAILAAEGQAVCVGQK